MSRILRPDVTLPIAVRDPVCCKSGSEDVQVSRNRIIKSHPEYVRVCHVTVSAVRGNGIIPGAIGVRKEQTVGSEQRYISQGSRNIQRRIRLPVYPYAVPPVKTGNIGPDEANFGRPYKRSGFYSGAPVFNVIWGEPTLPSLIPESEASHRCRFVIS